MAKFYYRVTIAHDIHATWDGDYPLDERRDWRAYTIQVDRRCLCCDQWEEGHDFLSDVWASVDSRGDKDLREIVRRMIGNRTPWANISIIEEM